MNTLSHLLPLGSPNWLFALRRNRALRPTILLVLLLTGCPARKENVQPAIEFTQVPPTSPGGPNTQGTIAGKVIGARLGQQIVLYARAGAWWVQPVREHPFAKIRSDQTWESPTHLGTEYAALLVDANYKPQNVTYELPAPGGQITAIAKVRGTAVSAAQDAITRVQFRGYEWNLRAVHSDRSGTYHDYDPRNAHVDDKGALHLQITERQGKWICSEVSLRKNLGYGMYLVTVEDISHLELATIFSFFTWDELATNPNHREMDVQISRWGNPTGENGRYVIQPDYIPANVSRFTAPAAQITFLLNWEPGKALFRTFRGGSPTTNSRAIAEHVFTVGIPTPGHETVRMDFCPVDNQASQQHPSEIVIRNFQYLP